MLRRMCSNAYSCVSSSWNLSRLCARVSLIELLQCPQLLDKKCRMGDWARLIETVCSRLVYRRCFALRCVALRSVPYPIPIPIGVCSGAVLQLVSCIVYCTMYKYMNCWRRCCTSCRRASSTARSTASGTRRACTRAPIAPPLASSTRLRPRPRPRPASKYIHTSKSLIPESCARNDRASNSRREVSI